MYRGVLRVWMKNLWHFTREYNESGNSVPLPSYVCIAFTNPETTRRIREQCDLAVRVIGRCVEALVVNKLAADMNSRNVLVSNDELAYLSAILGTESHDVRLCLSQPGTIELLNLASRVGRCQLLVGRSKAAGHAFCAPTDTRHPLSSSSGSRER